MRSVYVHIPFCRSKCGYCGFNSVPVGDRSILEAYTGCLVTDILNAGFRFQNLDTAYFGGGTPTVLSLDQIERVLNALGSGPAISRSTELTIEANPGTLDGGTLAGLGALGFNRLSLGAQSFDDGLLRLMGRPHGADQSVAAYQLARAAGFANIGLDMIFALPGQTLQQWEADLASAVRLGPEHISLYSLTYEGNSEFIRLRTAGKISPCADELEADMYLTAIVAMNGAGYEHYEISNFARPGFRSRHNLNYWRCGDYRGFGAGAHSHTGNKRWANRTIPADYIAAVKTNRALIGFEETLTRDQQLFEAVFLGLRMIEGIDIPAFTAQWGSPPWSQSPRQWESLEREGLLAVAGANARLTDRGLLLSDSVLARLAPGNSSYEGLGD